MDAIVRVLPSIIVLTIRMPAALRITDTLLMAPRAGDGRRLSGQGADEVVTITARFPLNNGLGSAMRAVLM